MVLWLSILVFVIWLSIGIVQSDRYTIYGRTSPIDSAIDIWSDYTIFNNTNPDGIEWEFFDDVNRNERSEPTYRLPNDTHPLSYEVFLNTRVDLNDFNFTGAVKIWIVADEPTDRITLQHRELTIEEILVFRNENEQQIAIREWIDDLDYEKIIIVLDPERLIVNSTYRVEIKYSGTLREDNAGFYRSSYINGNGERVYFATTQFSQTDARHGFPCYDEPGIKATFAIRITHGNRYNAISNMPVQLLADNNDGTITTYFETTPIMSTFIVGYIVSDYVNYSRSSPFNMIPHRTFARSNAIQKTTLGLNAGVLILHELEKYLGVDFNMPKLDIVPIPDFKFTAMENWGMITFIESRFLFDESVDTYELKGAVVSVLAHEIGHHWFGNLVSPIWWEFVWLKEGFARLFQYYAVNLVVSKICRIEMPTPNKYRKFCRNLERNLTAEGLTNRTGEMYS